MADKFSLRIVMVLENNPYPADMRVRNEAETLAAVGHQVVVIAPRKEDQPWREEINHVQVRRFRRPPEGHGRLSYLFEFGYATFICLFLVFREWATSGMDVLHVHNPPDTLFIVGLLPRLCGKKFVFDHHDLAPELYLAKYGGGENTLYKMLLMLEKWSCRFANRVITVNESYRQIDIQRNAVKPENIEVVRNGPPMRRVKPVECDPDLRARASILFGYLGSIAHQDGVDHLIQALFHLQKDFQYEDWYTVIIGPADNLDTLTDLVEQLNLKDKIWFTGYQSSQHWQRMLASVDICVVPDPINPLNEKSTMVKAMDYMALGKPIVAYDMTENRVTAGESALYARPSDPVDMARQFVVLIESPEKREELGQLGRQRISEGLAWEFSAERLISFYQNF